MKKLSELFKSSVLIILGGLLLLANLNNLTATGAYLALGIIAVIISSYYIVMGILDIFIGDKMSNGVAKIFSTISISSFAGLFFANILCKVIDGYQTMGPTAWVVDLVGMIASIAFMVVYIIAACVPNKALARLCGVFAAIFALGLVLDLLFLANGNAAQIDNISLVTLIIYACYAYIAFNGINQIAKE